MRSGYLAGKEKQPLKTHPIHRSWCEHVLCMEVATHRSGGDVAGASTDSLSQGEMGEMCRSRERKGETAEIGGGSTCLGNAGRLT